MASMTSLQTIVSAKPVLKSSLCGGLAPSSTVLVSSLNIKGKKKRPLTVVAAAGDVSADGTAYLIAGAAAVALLGTAFPILFSRKDT